MSQPLETAGIALVLTGILALAVAAWWLYPAAGVAVGGAGALFVGVVAVLAANRRSDT